MVFLWKLLICRFMDGLLGRVVLVVLWEWGVIVGSF